jgi:hypothetical protein
MSATIRNIERLIPDYPETTCRDVNGILGSAQSEYNSDLLQKEKQVKEAHYANHNILRA